MTRVILGALLSHWLRRPLQLATLLTGLALATALWSGVQAINAEARKSYDAAAGTLGGAASLVAANGGGITLDTFVALRRAGWRVSPVVEGWIDAGAGRVRLVGIDLFTAPPGPAQGALGAAGIGGVLGDDAAVFASPPTADRMTALARPVRTAEGLAPGVAVADIETAMALLDRTTFDRLVLHPDQPLVQAPLDTVAPFLTPDNRDTAEDLARLTDSFHLNLTAFGFLSFAVGLFIVNGAVGLAFEQRRPVFRTLRAIGVSARRLTFLLVAELLILALVAGLLGIALGWVVAALLLPDVAATLRGLYGATVEGSLTLSPGWWASGLGMAVAGTILAAATGLIQVALMPPLAGAKPRAWARASAMVMRGQLAGAGVFLALALLAAFFGGSLAAGFVLLGGLLLASALALPAVLAGFVLGIERVAGRGPLLHWFWADTRHQLPGLSLALMALLLALAANIGVGTMVGSFRSTFTGWLDQRLVSELYVTLEDETRIEAFRAFAAPRTDAILPIWHTEAELFGAPAEIYGIADHETYRENWPLLTALPDVWDRMSKGDGAMINEQLARREALDIGDALPLPGSPVIVGIYSDYGNPVGQVILPLSELVRSFPDVDRKDFGLRVDPEATPALRRALIEDFGLPEANIVDNRALKDFSLAVFERTFSVTAALNILTLAVAGIAILTSLLTLASMRLPQLAPVWAIGLPRGRLAALEFLRAILLALLTFLLALPVGLMLGWVLLAVINVQAFGWRLPMEVFPSDWIRLLALSLATAAAAGAWPAYRLSKLPPADLMRVFSHER